MGTTTFFAQRGRPEIRRAIGENWSVTVLYLWYCTVCQYCLPGIVRRDAGRLHVIALARAEEIVSVVPRSKNGWAVDQPHQPRRLCPFGK